MVMVILFLIFYPPPSHSYIELGPPSYGNPIYVLRQEKEPLPILGYRWFRPSEVDRFYFSIRTPQWNLYRTSKSPATDDWLFPNRAKDRNVEFVYRGPDVLVFPK